MVNKLAAKAERTASLSDDRVLSLYHESLKYDLQPLKASDQHLEPGSSFHGGEVKLGKRTRSELREERHQPLEVTLGCFLPTYAFLYAKNMQPDLKAIDLHRAQIYS